MIWRHALASLVALSLAGGWPQATPPPSRVNFPPSNPTRDIAEALSQARGDHKYVLLDFGADWCVDCRVLEEAFRDPAVAPFLRLHFHVVRIDVGEFFKGGDAFKNRNVALRYGLADPNETGVPVLVTLDGDGQVVYGTSRVHWAAARQFNLADVLLYLRKTLPPTTVSRLEAFTERGVRVEITYDHDIFGLNWLSARFTPTAAGFQLYGTNLARGGVDGAGRPTRFELTSPGGVRTRGPMFESVDARPERVEVLKQTFPMYPAGPVVLRIPITRPEQSKSKTEVSITYMACGPTGCLPPVEDKRISFTLKASGPIAHSPMFSASAEFYDLIYSTFKDYRAEGEQIGRLLRGLNPACESVLDVGCGTGEHAKLLAAQGFRVDGLDLDPTFVQIARHKNPAGRFFEADMCAFSLPHRYDAVVCLFSAIGYVCTLERMRSALVCFRQHLAPGGVIVVEPWFPPGGLDTSRVVKNIGEGGGVRVCRTSRVAVDGRMSRLFFEYEIENAAGLRHASEVHELGLFTTGEMIDAFWQAGLDVDHDPRGLSDRGLFVGRVAAEHAP